VKLSTAGAALGPASVNMTTPTNKRFLVIASLFLLSLILYIDRAAVSSAKSAIAGELALSDTEMGWVFGAFSLGYAFAQIPWGWFADRAGPRLALAIVVALWSVFTTLTGTASRLAWLLLMRFLFGVAEAGAFPGSARVFYNWLPDRERGIANGILFSGALLGGGLAFPLCQWLVTAYGWRVAFYFLGIPGLFWAVNWMIWFRNYPENQVECGAPLTNETPLLQVFRSWKMVKAMLQYFIGNFTFFVCITWMLPYLAERYSLTPSQAARFSMVPMLSGALANWVSGFFVDMLYRSRFRLWSRRLPATLGFFLAASGIYAVSIANRPGAAVTAFAVAMFGVEMTISPSWAYCIDIGRRNSGSISAAMNMAGSFGALASANAFPWLQRWTGNSGTYFRIAAALNALAILCWVSMGSVRGSDSARTSENGRVTSGR
jgi:ACS family glucarate transporter-like MFS transporter